MIVCMSRRICVDLYDAIVKLRPQWHDDGRRQGRDQGRDDRLGRPTRSTGSRTSATRRGREALAKRFKDPDDPLKLVIVRDMWLTGFDAPCLHTMYVDKPMQGHGLMQAIARVNRVFRDKPGGLVVDYLGLADQLKKALADYTEGRPRARPASTRRRPSTMLLEKYEIVAAMFHGFDYSASLHAARPPSGSACIRGRDGAHPRATSEDGKRRGFMQRGHRSCSQGVRPGRPRTTRRWRSATRSASSRPSGPGLVKSRRRRREVARGPRPRDPPARLEGGRLRPGDRHLRRRRPEEARTSRSCPTSSWPRCAACPTGTSPWSCCSKLLNDEIKAAVAQERGPGPVVRRDAGEDDPSATRTARSRRPQVIAELIELAKEMREAHQPRRGPGPDRRRAGLLRRPGSQRQRRQGARRRHPADHRPRAGRDGPAERHDRLDASRKAPGPSCGPS